MSKRPENWIHYTEEEDYDGEWKCSVCGKAKHEKWSNLNYYRENDKSVCVDGHIVVDYRQKGWPRLNAKSIHPEARPKWMLREKIKKLFCEKNTLKGGLADDMTISDIAALHSVSIESLERQLKDGIEVEMEHTDSKEKAEEIAMDHLAEDPEYYDKLKKIEDHE